MTAIGNADELTGFDIDNAEVAMFVGTNPTASHMMTMPQSNPTKRLRDAQKRGMKLIVVDPRRSDVARRADIHLQLRPGEDATLLRLHQEAPALVGFPSSAPLGTDVSGDGIADVIVAPSGTGPPSDWKIANRTRAEKVPTLSYKSDDAPRL